MALLAGVLVVSVLTALLIQTALQGIYSAALYQYATDRPGSDAFSGDVMQTAFKLKA